MTRQDVMEWRRGRAPRVVRWLTARRRAAHIDAEAGRRLLRMRRMWVEACERAEAFKESRYPTWFSPFELPK